MIKLFVSYHTDRNGIVSVNGSKSCPFTPLSGVPQGSNPGPLLFNIFINELPSILSCHTLMYADDIKLFLAINNDNECNFLQSNLNKFALWCNRNKLTININKCKVMSFCRTKTPINHVYTIDGVLLIRVDKFVDLGMTFDSKLTFNYHVDNVVNRSMKSLGFIFRLSRNFHRMDSIKLLYYALVSSKIEYASVIFTPRNKKQAKKIDRVYRKFAKFVIWKLEGVYPPRSLDNSVLYHRSGILPPYSRNCIALILFLAKKIKGSIDIPSLIEDVKFVKATRNLRSNNILKLHNNNNNNNEKYWLSSPINVMVSLINKLCRNSAIVDRLLGINNNISGKFVVICVEEAGLFCLEN